MTVAKLVSTEADCNRMQSTCQAGAGAHQGVHACWEDSSASHPSVVLPLGRKREHSSPFIRSPEVVSGRR